MSAAMDSNAFDPGFLVRIDDLDESPGGVAAECAGPWEVVQREDRFSVVLADAPEDRAIACFEQRSDALLMAALLPPAAAEPIFVPLPEQEAGTLALAVAHRPHDPSASARTPPDGTLAALNLLAHLVRNPRSLALVLESAGVAALRIAGRLLRRRLERVAETGRFDLDLVAEALEVPPGPGRRRELLAILEEHRRRGPRSRGES